MKKIRLILIKKGIAKSLKTAQKPQETKKEKQTSRN